MLQVIEIIDTMIQGFTKPVLCYASNGERYVVKGHEATTSGLIKEYVCASLGKKFGLPIPDFCLIEFSDELLAHDGDLQRRFGGEPCFASKFESNLQEFDRSSYVEKHSELFRKIFIFDYWVKNDDRTYVAKHGGNPNLLIDSSRESIYVIDHNLAFAEDFDLESFKRTHVGSKFWCQQQIDLFVRHHYHEGMHNSLSIFDTVIGELPDEWVNGDFCENELIKLLKLQLESFNTDKFWSDIK